MARRPLLAAALALAVGATACRDAPEPAVVPMPAPDGAEPWIAAAEPPAPVASYRIRASFDPATHRIRGSQVLTWRNTGRSPVTALPFHLYMNAFKNEASVFMRESGGTHRSAEA
ncbi:MAG TPA: hypothetical protein VKZ63_12415, partial [Kofleriaceae bacterium]|nr:hypothetical protein [Kofleriaceae bacterium]